MDCERFPLSCQVANVADAIGPHTADWWMVWLTSGSIIASLILGWLAYRNGKKATDIANEVAVREQEHKLEEADLRQRATRLKVARAMSDAVISAQYWATLSSRDLPGLVQAKLDPLNASRDSSPLVDEAATAANIALTSALSLIKIHVESPNHQPLYEWLGGSIGIINERVTKWKIHQSDVVDFHLLRTDLVTDHNLGEIHKWAHGPLENAPTPALYSAE